MPNFCTLRDARRAISADLGEDDIIVATAVDASADAQRTIVSEQLVDDEISDSLYGAGFLYCAASGDPISVVNVGVQRRTRRVAIDGGAGSLVTTAPWPAIPQVGDEYEYSRRMPAIRHLGHQGIREAINAGLMYWNIEDRVDMTGVGGQYAYPLQDLPFMGDEARILHVYDPSWSGMPQLLTRYPWTLNHNYELPALEFSGIAPYASGEAWSLGVWRAANTRIYDSVSAAWVDTTVGLVHDDDACRVEIGVVVELGLWKAYGFLAAAAGAGAGAETTYRRQEAMHGAICQQLKRDRAAELGGWPVTPQAMPQVTWAKGWVPGG